MLCDLVFVYNAVGCLTSVYYAKANKDNEKDGDKQHGRGVHCTIPLQCGACYIGQTGRCVLVNVSENMHAIYTTKTKVS